MPKHMSVGSAGRRPAIANERFKRRAREWFWFAVVLSVGMHAVAFALPLFEADTGWTPAASEPLSLIEITEALSLASVLPAIPEILRPDLPRVPDVPELDMTDLTVPDLPVGLDAGGILIPPVVAVEDGLDGYTEFMPTMVKPELKNRRAVKRALERGYPPRMRATGGQGSVVVVLWIDENGEVRKHEIEGYRGSEDFDRVAGKVVPMMEFTPSFRNGSPARTIVRLPINFSLR